MEFVPPASTGLDRPKTPMVFGWYEVGRSSDPAVLRRQTPVFKDTTPQGTPLELTGDPGQYDPWAYDDLTSQGYNQNRKAFDSTSFREMNLNIGESYTAPGPGYYVQHSQFALGRAYRAVDSQRSVFRSTSLQRPSARSFVPGPGNYSPNMNSVYPNQRDSGAKMRSVADRFGPVSFGHAKCMTPRKVGPGCYAQVDRTLYVEAQRSTAKSSRSRPGFGSTSAQRSLPVRAPRDSPAPGSHQPRVGGFLPRTPRSGSRTPRTPRGGGGRTPRGGVEGAFASLDAGARASAPEPPDVEAMEAEVRTDGVRQVV